MKKIIPFGMILLMLSCNFYTPQFAPENIVRKIRRHTVSIATYYVMNEPEYSKFMAEKSGIIKVPVKVDEPKRAAAIIGSGTIVKDNHVVTVRHMFDDHYGVSFSAIWVFIPGWDHAVEAELVCKSKEGTFWDDYAVIRLKEKVRLPGLPIAKKQPNVGEKVIFTGSVGGFAFFSRFGYVTELHWNFRRAADGTLHLTPWEEFPYMVTFPGGPGDSGGSICNIKGELAGIMYCGVTNYSEEYIFSNPLSKLREFLKGVIPLSIIEGK